MLQAELQLVELFFVKIEYDCESLLMAKKSDGVLNVLE